MVLTGDGGWLEIIATIPVKESKQLPAVCHHRTMQRQPISLICLAPRIPSPTSNIYFNPRPLISPPQPPGQSTGVKFAFYVGMTDCGVDTSNDIDFAIDLVFVIMVMVYDGNAFCNDDDDDDNDDDDSEGERQR